MPGTAEIQKHVEKITLVISNIKCVHKSSVEPEIHVLGDAVAEALGKSLSKGIMIHGDKTQLLNYSVDVNVEETASQPQGEDRELRVLDVVVRELAALPSAERQRVVEYVVKRFNLSTHRE